MFLSKILRRRNTCKNRKKITWHSPWLLNVLVLCYEEESLAKADTEKSNASYTTYKNIEMTKKLTQMVQKA